MRKGFRLPYTKSSRGNLSQIKAQKLNGRAVAFFHQASAAVEDSLGQATIQRAWTANIETALVRFQPAPQTFRPRIETQW